MGEFSTIRNDQEKCEEEVKLLDGTEAERPHQRASREKLTHGLHGYAFLLSNLLLLALTVSINVSGLLRKAPVDPSQGFYSPVQDHIQYYNTNFKRSFGGHVSPYQGWPSDEIDEQWQRLYSKGSFLRVNPEEGVKLPNQTEHVPLPGQEEDFVIGFDVFHQLHCLNMLRQSIYPRRYNTSLADSKGRVYYSRWLHLDHCVDSIRQYIMCHADVSAIYYKWLPHAKQIQPMIEGVHTCRNFTAIHEWAWQRALDIPDIYRHVAADGNTVTFAPPDDFDMREHDVSWNAPGGWNYTIDDL